MQTVDDNRRTRSSSFDQLQPNGATPTPPLPLPPLLLLLQLKFGGVIWPCIGSRSSSVTRTTATANSQGHDCSISLGKGILDAAKSNPQKLFAVFSATAWNFCVKFYRFTWLSYLHLIAKWHLIIIKHDKLIAAHGRRNTAWSLLRTRNQHNSAHKACFTWTAKEDMFYPAFVCLFVRSFVCLTVCLSVSRIIHKVVENVGEVSENSLCQVFARMGIG